MYTSKNNTRTGSFHIKFQANSLWFSGIGNGTGIFSICDKSEQTHGGGIPPWQQNIFVHTWYVRK